MPLRFPWKKKKTGTRISQMVKDQFHRRKNAASPLVVETGFPTSIVDLIVNHRDRFKKPSSPSLRSKRNNPPPPPPPLIDDPDFVSPPQSPPPPPPPSTSLTSPALLILPPGIAVPITGEQESDAPSHRGESRPQDIVIQGEDGICNTVKPNRVLVVVLMIFLMVVLALGTKKFAMGITMSAFLLFFLEYLGKHVPGFFTPYSKAKERLRPIVMGAWSFVSSKMARLEEEDEDEDCVFKAPLVESVSPPVCSFGECDGKSSVIQEIEIEELEEVQYRNEKSCEKSFFDRKLKCEGDLEVRMEKETEVRSEFSEFKIEESHKAKIKSKMKMVVPKKFRSLRKKPKDLETELTPTRDGNFSVLEEKEYHQELEFEHESKLSGIVNVRDACDAITSSGDLIDGVVETMVVAKDNSLEKEENSGYMVLFLIALLGLVGGRVFALLFILAWCFLSRSREAIRRCLKVPTVRSFINV
nr:ethylene-responsive nuclear protein [Ipomoea batatas]